MSKYDSTYSAINAINTSLGYEALNYNSTYGAAKALLINLGGEDKPYDSLYSILVELATMAENGQIGGGGDGSDLYKKMEEDYYHLKSYDYDKCNYMWENVSVGNYGLYILDSLFPYLYGRWSYESYPLQEQTYSLYNNQWEYILDNNDNQVYCPTNLTFINEYLPKIQSGEYVWGENDISITSLIGQPIPYSAWSLMKDFDDSPLSQYNFGFPKDDGTYYKPFEKCCDTLYVGDQSVSGDNIFLFRNRDWNRTWDNAIVYNDKVNTDTRVIKGIPVVNHNKIWVGNDLMRNVDKFLFIDPNHTTTLWYGYYGVETYTIKDIKLIDEPELRYFDFNNEDSSLNSPYRCRINAPIDFKFRCQFGKKKPALLMFDGMDLIKSINIDATSYTNEYMGISLVDNVNLEYLNIDSNGIPVKLCADTSGRSLKVRNCTNLKNLPLIDCDRITSYDFNGTNSLTDIGGFLNWKVNARNSFLSSSYNLTVESLMNVINNIYDWSNGPADGKYTWEDGSTYSYGTTHTLGLGSTNLAKLTPEQIAVATNKGWTLI